MRSRVYNLGGDTSGTASAVTNVISCIAIASITGNAISKGGLLSSNRMGAGSSPSNNGTIYCVQGYSTSPLSTSDAYATSIDTTACIAKGNMASALWELSAASTNSSTLSVGGANAGTASSQPLELVWAIDTATAIAKGNLPSAICYGTASSV